MPDTSTLVKTAGEFVIGSLTNTINSFLNISSFLDLAQHGKPYFLFPNVLKRWSFQNNRSGIWPLLYYQQKWYFFLLKISSYSLDKKWKMIFLKKNKCKYDIFFKCSEKMVFSNKLDWNMIFLVLSEKVVFFFQENIFFLWTENLSQEIHRTTIFSVCMNKCYKHDITLLQKSYKLFSPEKIHLNVIDILDRILERVTMILCTLWRSS